MNNYPSFMRDFYFAKNQVATKKGALRHVFKRNEELFVESQINILKERCKTYKDDADSIL